MHGLLNNRHEMSYCPSPHVQTSLVTGNEISKGHWSDSILCASIIRVAKCNLGKVNLQSMRPAVFLTNLHAGWPHGFASPCADGSALIAICFCFAIIVDCFASKFPSRPFQKSNSGEVLCYISISTDIPFSVMVLVGGRRQGWFPLIGSP